MPASPFHEQDPVDAIATGFLGAERVHPVLDARDIRVVVDNVHNQEGGPPGIAGDFLEPDECQERFHVLLTDGHYAGGKIREAFFKETTRYLAATFTVGKFML